MASSLLLLLLFSLIPLIASSFIDKPTSPNALILPLTKHPSTHHYLTHLHTGTPPTPTKLVVDLNGPFLWLDCTTGHASSSHRSIPSTSLHCSRAKATTGCGSDGETCSLDTVNAITRAAARGELVEDILAVERVDRVNPIATVDHFLFLCAPRLLAIGLPSGVNGMLGLGRSRISLPSQVHRKFAVCLSSDGGFIFSGDRVRSDVSLMYTPLVSRVRFWSGRPDRNFGQDVPLGDYYINVRSIRINDKTLSLNTSKLSMDHKGNGGTKLSTIVPYTTMESTIYETFMKAYLRAATAMNMTRVALVAPFGACFSSDGIDRTRVGPAVPRVDLVMQSGMVRWRMYGRNSMVEVSDGVMCLGFLDGGLSARAAIEIGGYQMEDHLLEFNLATSMFGFSSSLLARETSCSDSKLYSVPSESL